MSTAKVWRNNGLALRTMGVGELAARVHATLARALLSVVVTAWAWRERARQRRDLLALTPREVRDVGLSRADVEREGRKPFWRP